MGAPVLDPFFDSGSRAIDRPDTANTVTRPGYTDTTQAVLENGQPILQALPMGPSGLRGVVIPPHAGNGGVPQGYNPHDLRGVKVHIDPHIHGQQKALDLTDLAKEAVAMASDEATNDINGSPELTQALTDPMARRRFRASTALHNVDNSGPLITDVDQNNIGLDLPVTREMEEEQARRAAEAERAAAANAPRVAPTNQAQTPPPAQPAPPVLPQKVASPLAAFGQTPPEQAPMPPSAASQMNFVDTSKPLAPATEAPGRRVQYELQGYGQLEAWYHEIIIQDDKMILVYNNEFTGGQKFFPSGDKQIAVAVAGTGLCYLAQPTGIQYPQGNSEHCVLLIQKSVPYDI
jgi:hypothetical protein